MRKCFFFAERVVKPWNCLPAELHHFISLSVFKSFVFSTDLSDYPRRARSALGVDTVLTLDVCLYVCMYVSALERKRLIGMT